jgi:hypothetical protein
MFLVEDILLLLPEEDSRKYKVHDEKMNVST